MGVIANNLIKFLFQKCLSYKLSWITIEEEIRLNILLVNLKLFISYHENFEMIKLKKVMDIL